ncbi:hypothetical protein [Bosea sp. (in: a-proteobacteria)]|jgi:hypothetical protein|nr:hypothetical protein [Bosea sp. (in: a-proteobacteria)]
MTGIVVMMRLTIKASIRSLLLESGRRIVSDWSNPKPRDGRR